MIYPPSKKQCLCEDKLSRGVMLRILKFVGNVSYCSAVKKSFVPPEYVTSVKVIDEIDMETVSSILAKRPSVRFVELFRTFPNDWSAFFQRHVLLEKVFLRGCLFFEFPVIFAGTKYSLDGHVWTMKFQRDETEKQIDIVLSGDESILQYMPLISPNTVVFNILNAINTREKFNNPHYGQIMPFMDCSQDEFQKFKATLYILQCCFCSIKVVKIFEDSKAAMIIETFGGSGYGIFLLRKKDSIWKDYHVYRRTDLNFGHAWNWDDVFNV